MHVGSITVRGARFGAIAACLIAISILSVIAFKSGAPVGSEWVTAVVEILGVSTFGAMLGGGISYIFHKW
ncbi:MAG: hypothetical protein N2C12_10815 [Planctomycetales bacterium]